MECNVENGLQCSCESLFAFTENLTIILYTQQASSACNYHCFELCKYACTIDTHFTLLWCALFRSLRTYFNASANIPHSHSRSKWKCVVVAIQSKDFISIYNTLYLPSSHFSFTSSSPSFSSSSIFHFMNALCFWSR